MLYTTRCHPPVATLLSGLALAGLMLLAQSKAQMLCLPLTHAVRGSMQQNDQDIADKYLTAYQLCRKAELLASQKQWHSAINQAQQSERILAAIVRDYPAWRVELVSMRRKIVADNLRTYRGRLKDQGSRSPRNPIARNPQPFNPEVTSRSTNRASVNLDQTPHIAPGTINNNRQMYNELMRTREELRRMVVAYKELRTTHEKTQQKLLSAELNRDGFKKRLAELERALQTERNASGKVVASLNRQLKELQKKYDSEVLAHQEAQKQADALQAELSELEARHELISQEHSQLLAENSRLKEIIELNSPEKTKALLDQNITLSSQLKQAEERVAQLEAQLSAQGDEQQVLVSQLAQARQESDRLRDEVARIYDENLGYRRRISELSESLHQLEGELDANASTPSMDPAMQEENQLLRSIVAKQKGKLEEQKKAQSLLLEAYRQMKNQNPQLLSSLEQIEDENALDLTHLEDTLIQAVQSADAAETARSQATDAAVSEAASLAAREAAAAAAKETAIAIRAGLEVEALATGAQKAFAAQRYTAAEQLYRTLVDAHPDHLAGLVNLGSILLHRNKHEEAIHYLQRASRLAPGHASSYQLMGTAYYLLDQLDSAASQFRRSLECDPANEDAFFYLANIETLNGAHEKALKYLAAAIKLNPELGDAHYNMARIYIDLGRYADASRAYDRAVHHGATPDLDLENHLRDNPQSLGVPGEDLIATVIPEQQAQELRDARLAAESGAGASESSPEGELSVAQLRARIAQDITAAPTPSPAGAGHELDAALFSSTKITVKGKKVELRVKARPPQRLRSRGGPLPGESTGDPSPRVSKNSRKKG